MPDLAVVVYRKSGVDMRSGFDVGAGPSPGVERAVSSLQFAAEEGELDEETVDRVAWMQDWETIVMGERRGWTTEEAGDVTTAVCSREELARIIETMLELRSLVDPKLQGDWDELARFLASAYDRGETIALWYDPVG